MGADSKIEWTRHTHNPWIGCTAVSPACDHCYAEQLGKRFGVKWGSGEVRRRTSDAYRRQPFTWDRAAAKSGRVDPVFCASLADIWDNAVPIEWLVEELDTIRLTLHLRWLLLTKRPQLIRRRLDAALKHLSMGTTRGDLIGGLAMWLSGNPPDNVLLGTTVENQAEADRRIPHLLAVPAAGRFLSCEPLLGAVDLRQIVLRRDGERPNDLSSRLGDYVQPLVGNFRDSPRLHWIIAGGESGPTARPTHPDWFRSLRDQCAAAHVPFIFKQWGEWRPICEGHGDWYDPLYRSLRKAKDGEDQTALDEAYGRACTVPTICLRFDGQHVGITEPMAFQQGTRPMLGFRVGKKAAGATLDGREWREVPA